MKRDEFECLEEHLGFDNAMCVLENKINTITSYEILKEFIISKIEEDNFVLASHLIDAMKDCNGYDWFFYDFSAGTFDTPKPIKDIEDLEDLFEKRGSK